MSGMSLVTGGAGFLGSAVARGLVGQGARVLNVDALTYAADERRLASLPTELLQTVTIDVAAPGFGELVTTEEPDLLLHLAAETHVTRSETDLDRFFRTNVEGTRSVLDAARLLARPRVVHVSTDEVYGPFAGTRFTETDKVRGEGQATSPYARSKALADDLAVDADARLNVSVVRPTNCYGPWQHPEKAIPRWITRALLGRPMPVWGKGDQVRDWMYVDDFCSGLEIIAAEGEPQGVYNLAPEAEPVSNLEVARAIFELAAVDGPGVYLTEYDRPDHDQRYAIDAGRARAVGWRPEVPFAQGLQRTVEWYREKREWWEPMLQESESLYSDAQERHDES